jgi:hypothetical protein
MTCLHVLLQYDIELLPRREGVVRGNRRVRSGSSAPVAAAGDRSVAQTGPRKVEEHGFILNSGRGGSTRTIRWARIPALRAGRKAPRVLLPVRPQRKKAATDALFAIVGKSDPLDAVLNGQIATNFKTFGNYAPSGRSAGPCGLRCDRSRLLVRTGNIKGVYHWCIVRQGQAGRRNADLPPLVLRLRVRHLSSERSPNLHLYFDAVLDSAKLAEAASRCDRSGKPGRRSRHPDNRPPAPSPTPAEQGAAAACRAGRRRCLPGPEREILGAAPQGSEADASLASRPSERPAT